MRDLEKKKTIALIKKRNNSDGDGWIVIWKMRTRRPILKWKAHKDNCLKVTTLKNNTLIRQEPTFCRLTRKKKLIYI